jgi:hypothetical protein
VSIVSTSVSPSTMAPRNEHVGELDCMPPADLLVRTDSKRTLGTFQKDGMTMLYAEDSPNATIQPFRVWHPSRMKSGLRNRPIGRKIVIILPRACSGPVQTKLREVSGKKLSDSPGVSSSKYLTAMVKRDQQHFDSLRCSHVASRTFPNLEGAADEQWQLGSGDVHLRTAWW